MEEKSIFDQPNPQYNMQQPLQNATTVLVLGILSIIICFAGVVLGIIAVVLANKDMRLYKASPEIYTEGSYKNLKAVRVCAIVGLVLNVLLAIFYVVAIRVALASFSRFD